MIARFFCGVFLVAVMALFVGCGSSDTPELGSVSGTVTLDGAPLAGATVMFRPKAGGRPAMADTDEQGKYVLRYNPSETGGVVGLNLVRISKKGEAASDEEVAKELIPAKYNEESTLEYEVGSGKNEINIELSSK